MKNYAIVPLLALMLALTACASFVTPKTPDQTVYATYGLYVAVSDTTADLLESNAITVGRAKTVQSRLQEMRPQIDAAKALVDDGRIVPENEMDLVRSVQEQLLALQSRLQKEAAQ